MWKSPDLPAAPTWTETEPPPTEPDFTHNRLVATVDETECTPCGACQSVCPSEAITLGESAVKVNAQACSGCGACAEVCPNGAIKLL
jgi:MinD superfamily P-loop ATPase